MKEEEIYEKNKKRNIMVDKEDEDLIKEHVWTTNSGYAKSTFKIKKNMRRIVKLHDEIMMRKLEDEIPEGYVVDHINGNTLDDRRENLRLATTIQNSYNRKPNSGRQYKGVTKSKYNTYRAAIGGNDDNRSYIGSFGTIEEAAYAYNNEAHYRWGEFAYLNELPIVTNVKTGQVVTGKIYDPNYKK